MGFLLKKIQLEKSQQLQFLILIGQEEAPSKKDISKKPN